MADRLPQLLQGDPHLQTREHDGVHQPLKLGDPIPVLCNAHDLAHVFGCSIKTIYRWSKQGKLRRLELRRPIGDRRWSGKAVEAFADEHGFRSLKRSA